MSEESKPRKKAVNGRAKGGGFELTIAKLFSERFAPLQFRRSQSSGAILGGMNHVNIHKFSEDAKALFIGDIVPTNEADVVKAEGWRFKFTIECKFYKDCDTLNQLFKNPQVTRWYEQARTDAAKIVDKVPLLIFKFNHTMTFGAVETELMKPPLTAETLMTLRYKIDGDQRELFMFKLDEALQDEAWFKTDMV